MIRKPISLLLSLFLTVLVSRHAPAVGSLGDDLSNGHNHGMPPAHAAAGIYPSAGSCIQFISVFVPSQGGEYVVGISFAYRDVNGDGRYTPGVDRMEVCVNCADACGYGP